MSELGKEIQSGMPEIQSRVYEVVDMSVADVNDLMARLQGDQ